MTKSDSKTSFKEIKDRANPWLVAILEALAQDGQIQGNEYLLHNPHRQDGSLGSFKFNIESGLWADFAADGASGSDIISLVAYLHAIEPHEAARLIVGMIEQFELETLASSSIPSKRSASQERSKPPDIGVPVCPVPADAPQADDFHGGLRTTLRHRYTDENGRDICFVCRFDPKGRDKYYLPQTYRQMSDGSYVWRWKGLDTARPLYNLFELSSRQGVPVLIVEGEKSADAAKQLFPQHVVVTTMNGAQSPGKTDFSPLHGRDILIWPDIHSVGRSVSMDRIIAKILYFCTVLFDVYVYHDDPVDSLSSGPKTGELV